MEKSDAQVARGHALGFAIGKQKLTIIYLEELEKMKKSLESTKIFFSFGLRTILSTMSDKMDA